jgi:predicted kinase
MSKAKLYIIRGLSGSGKTTLAKELYKKYPNSKMFAADDFFTKGNKYEFDASKLGLAHGQCYEQTRQCLLSGNTAIVHNTFTTYSEVKKYLELVDELKCEYAILEPSTEWKNSPEECLKMNTHSVPLEAIIRMKNRWQTTDEILKLWQAERNLKKEK